jgi:hypothetical protein
VLLAKDGGEWWVLSFIIVAVAVDTGAYAAGITLGKHPMAPRISPKKTWEGFAGGAGASVVAGVLLSLFMLGNTWWFGLIFGAAIFLTATPDATPHALLHNLNHNKVLHERVVFLTVEIRDVPWVTFEERVKVQRMGQGCWRVNVRFGFMNRPDVMRALEVCGALGLEFDMMQTSFFLSRQQVVPSPRGGSTMARWRERMFAAMARNAGNITDYFNIPTNRVIELGTRVEI